MSWSGWALVGFACVGFFITYTVTLIGGVWWLNKQFENTRHTMYGALGVSKSEMKDFIEDAERRLTVAVHEIKDEFKEFRGEFKKLEERVRQIEMIRLAEKSGNRT